MSSPLVDGLFELRALLKNGDLDEAQRKLRLLIMEAEKGGGDKPAGPDPLAGSIRDWLCGFLDDEHAVELARPDKRQRDDNAFARHVAERRKVLEQGLTAGESVAGIVRLCELLGHDSEADNLTDGLRQLQHFLRHHLIMDEKLRVEVSVLGQFLADSLGHLEEMTSHLGDEDSELNQARSILSQPLAEDPKTAYEQLSKACEFLTSAGSKLDSAVQSVTEQMKSHVQEVDSLRSRLSESEREARSDPLTGLSNRRELEACFAKLGDESATLLMLDLDHFKKINDTHGHDVGDEVLTETGLRLANTIRGDDIVARIGGEEFVTVLKGVGGAAAGKIAEQIRLAVSAKPIATAAGELPVTASAGVATRQAGESIESCLKRADQALYAAKQHGRNRTNLAD
ncbi:MAG: hypothetical protein COS82_09490 [Zetaproteobacteria bacterium CG06_land_8_20_14_3_00_59_53]|nr:MAG: hypothetical protein COX56_11295 [Zetaproteobacteria bacterium CG23_combo_of_CG06-09_8_20_14_all_59_86]PIQ65381.1 MAG: hypothetical protein COV97_03295 [Zetaproteobacteria bacterium CG11_big_fil_rev_8_21_14_0_20_59_439]PIU69633.1 MAG: hypothetical protein COS82_09490 [Zetaproteobacteria bacterium CG06_land_8_20_14_3_00_59_53]PIU96880.1 MAG: hypothetical protein COS62_05620 [Zetaproteobacteria bacterium CG03_land_8_20_14_0_80_59_51]PIY47548.1 MAG: hypothetical protein COZ02_00865 [Zetapr